MELFLSWLALNWASVLLGVVFVVGAIYLWQKGYKKQVSLYLFTLIAKAELQFEHGANKEKLDSVLTEIYNAFPYILKFFYSKENMIKVINDLVAETKEWLQNQSK